MSYNNTDLTGWPPLLTLLKSGAISQEALQAFLTGHGNPQSRRHCYITKFSINQLEILNYFCNLTVHRMRREILNMSCRQMLNLRRSSMNFSSFPLRITLFSWQIQTLDIFAENLFKCREQAFLEEAQSIWSSFASISYRNTQRLK